MNSATIVVKKPKLFVPDELLNTVSSRCPTAFGFAGRLDGKLVCEISPRTIPLEELKELQKAFNDEHLIMYFANFPKAVVPDDVQPWSVVGASGEHIVMLFAEGNFGEYANMNGDHTDVSNAFDEVVFPRLSKAMNDADQNVDRFYEELRKENLQKTLSKSFKDRGYYVFLPLKGDPICFGNVPNGLLDLPWGLVTNSHGWVAKVEAPASTKPALAFMRGGGVAVPAPKATPDVEVPVTSPNRHEDPEPPVPELEPSGGDGLPKSGKENKEKVGINPAIAGKTPQQLEAAGWRKTFPPPKLARGKARNFWLRVFNGGMLPPDHESSQCSVWVSPDIIDLSNRTATSKGEVENIAYQVNKRRKEAAGSGAVSTTQTPIEQKAIAEAATAAEILTGREEKPITSGKSTVREAYVPSGTPSAGTSPYLPTMSDDEKLKAMVIMDEYFQKDKRPTPLEVQKGESKHATFSQSTGYKFTDLLFIPVEQVYKLFDGNKIAVAAFIEMRRNYIESSGVKLEDLVASTSSTKVEKKEEPKVSVPSVAPKTQSGALGFLNRRAG